MPSSTAAGPSMAGILLVRKAGSNSARAFFGELVVRRDRRVKSANIVSMLA